jgi:hypothetical protein
VEAKTTSINSLSERISNGGSCCLQVLPMTCPESMTSRRSVQSSAYVVLSAAKLNWNSRQLKTKTRSVLVLSLTGDGDVQHGYPDALLLRSPYLPTTFPLARVEPGITRIVDKSLGNTRISAVGEHYFTVAELPNLVICKAVDTVVQGNYIDPQWGL